mmetsp:Transcript_11227/g.25501  ORF Transcript_11227/g.25501 Transcript_11227/m.25501 type:complete len:346 (-) Transcript_11227:387-1424(-)
MLLQGLDVLEQAILINEGQKRNAHPRHLLAVHVDFEVSWIEVRYWRRGRDHQPAVGFGEGVGRQRREHSHQLPHWLERLAEFEIDHDLVERVEIGGERSEMVRVEPVPARAPAVVVHHHPRDSLNVRLANCLAERLVILDVNTELGLVVALLPTGLVQLHLVVLLHKLGIVELFLERLQEFISFSGFGIAPWNTCRLLLPRSALLLHRRVAHPEQLGPEFGRTALVGLHARRFRLLEPAAAAAAARQRLGRSRSLSPQSFLLRLSLRAFGLLAFLALTALIFAFLPRSPVAEHLVFEKSKLLEDHSHTLEVDVPSLGEIPTKTRHNTFVDFYQGVDGTLTDVKRW